jgi:hypothetical protein
MAKGFLGVGPRESGIDDCSALVIEERITIDVTETGYGNRQLHAQDVGSDFCHLRTRVFLFLLARLHTLNPVGVERIVNEWDWRLGIWRPLEPGRLSSD